MLLVGINEIEPGMQAGVVIGHPRFRQTALVRPGAPLTPKIVSRLRGLGITQVWVDHDITRDLDVAVSPRLTEAKEEVYEHLKRDLADVSKKTICTANVQIYREALVGLVNALTDDALGGIAQNLASADSDLFSHSTRVAYLSIVVGLKLTDYIRIERSRAGAIRFDMALTLGLAGALHDIGKTGLGEKAAALHEVHLGKDEPDREEYRSHQKAAYEMLRGLDISATARQAVLNHHQRFNGRGWPDLKELTGGRKKGSQRQKAIHIYTRIVSAANVLDNLLRDADGSERPVVAALHDFVGTRFDGWFDPRVRVALVRCVPAFGVGCLVRLSDGRRAAVIDTNRNAPCQPTVRLFGSRQSDGEDEYETIDLSKQRELHITECAGADVSKWLFKLPNPRAAQRCVA